VSFIDQYNYELIEEQFIETKIRVKYKFNESNAENAIFESAFPLSQ
jgi:hypothetical protein